ncbi:MAG: hypothetical protein HY611_01405 [Elusimicrobia bacterium]|nr:hypothetical protein [Elusimicrobiota bacterium]
MPRAKKSTEIAFDYPKTNEVISSSHYAFRIQTRLAGNVDISINDGPWTPCRPAVGYWWFDWAPDGKARGKAVGRVLGENGQIFQTPARFFRASTAQASARARQASRRVASGRK